MTYFFDTYAIIEIVRGSETYSKYFGASFVITQLNLIELHYFLQRELPDQAETMLNKYSRHAMPITNEIITDANKFRYLNRKKELSTADAIGYICARKLGLVFVTGDRQFQGIKDVLLIR